MQQGIACTALPCFASMLHYFALEPCLHCTAIVSLLHALNPCALLCPARHLRQVGSDDDGYAVRLKLKHFMAYCSHPEHAPADDSPL